MTAWNKGLTKETDKRIAEYALKKKQWFADPANAEKIKERNIKIGEKSKGRPGWSKGLTKDTDERVMKLSKAMIEARKVKKWPSWDKGISGNPDSPNYDPRLDYMMGENNPAKRPEVREKISKNKRENNPMQLPENRKKVSEGLRKLYASGFKNKNIGKHYSEKARQNMSIGQRRRMKNNPEEWARTCRKAGLTTHKKHPNQAHLRGKATQERHPGLSSRIAIRTNREWKERDPEDYRAKKLEYARLMVEAAERKKKEHPEQYHSDHIKAGLLSLRSNRDGQPFIWNDVHFMSNAELECAKLLLTKPIDGVNCNVAIGRKEIDFFPQAYDKLHQGKFVEYHPFDREKTEDEYYQARKQVIDNSKYNGTELVVITNLKEIK